MVKKHKNQENAAEMESPETGKAPEVSGDDIPASPQEKEAAEAYDKYVRAVAELENYKKRTQKEKAEAIKYGNECLIKDLLPLLDSLDRATNHAADSKDFDAFRKGLELVQNQFLSCLKKHGVEEIETKGKNFDPYVHEAMLQEESEEHEDNSIITEFEKGYTLNGRLLRPARVSVCKRKGCNNGNDNSISDQT